jgi:hypothetical protein
MQDCMPNQHRITEHARNFFTADAVQHSAILILRLLVAVMVCG